MSDELYAKAIFSSPEIQQEVAQFVREVVAEALLAEPRMDDPKTLLQTALQMAIAQKVGGILSSYNPAFEREIREVVAKIQNEGVRK